MTLSKDAVPKIKKQLIQMKSLFSVKQYFFGFFVFWIRHTAIYRTNCRTLWLLVKSRTFGTLIWYDVIHLIRNGCKLLLRVNDISIFQCKMLRYACTISNTPLNTCLINGIIRAFGLTCSTVNTLFGDNNCHD